MTAASAWLLGHRADPRARARLLCFPYAGGGATIFSCWQAGLPAQIDVCAVQLPGRQSRLADPPIGRLDNRELLDLVLPALRADLTACETTSSWTSTGPSCSARSSGSCGHG